MQKKHIFIIDDDKEIAHLVKALLEKNNYRVSFAYHGNQLSKHLNASQFDLILLDVMLPGKDGLTLCMEIRQQSSVPIIMLSAAQTEADKVAGLELGADDYISKPFSSRELLARIKAQIRRTSGALKISEYHLDKLQNLKFDVWQLDRNTQTLISLDNIVTALSKREYDLLMTFIENPKRILSRDKLMDKVYGKNLDPLDRSIDVLIGRLRKKIEQDPKNPKLLKTLRGNGYQLLTNVETL